MLDGVIHHCAKRIDHYGLHQNRERTLTWP